MPNLTTLANGVRILSHASPSRHSVSLGLWWLHGSRHQSQGQSGFVHLLEHLVFKGNSTYSSQQLSDDFEAMGGQINASTGRELTSFYGLVPRQHWQTLLTRFSSMLLDPGFTADELALELDVVIQEMAMVEDDTEEWLEEQAVAAVWPEHSLGWPILGSEQDLRAATVTQLKHYLRQQLTGDRLLIVATGAIDHNELVEACQPFSQLPMLSSAPLAPVQFKPGQLQLQQDQQQSYLLWLMPAPALYSSQYPTAVLANHLLGGGSSSRLFQRIREQLGLVYGIDSRLELYRDTGLWLIQTSCDPEDQSQCQAEVEQILTELAQQGVSDTELALSKAHLQASLQLDQDDIQAQQDYLAQQCIYAGRFESLEQQLAQLQQVSRQDIQQFFAESLQQLSRFEASPEH